MTTDREREETDRLADSIERCIQEEREAQKGWVDYIRAVNVNYEYEQTKEAFKAGFVAGRRMTHAEA